MVPCYPGPCHLTDPGDEGGHSGEHGGLLGGVAAAPVHKAGDSLDIPPPIGALTAQGPSRVPLERWQIWKEDKILTSTDSHLTHDKTFHGYDRDSGVFRLKHPRGGGYLRGRQTCSLLQRIPSRSSQSRPTSRYDCRRHAPPQEVRPAGGWTPWALQLTHTGQWGFNGYSLRLMAKMLFGSLRC